MTLAIHLNSRQKSDHSNLYWISLSFQPNLINLKLQFSRTLFQKFRKNRQTFHWRIVVQFLKFFHRKLSKKLVCFSWKFFLWKFRQDQANFGDSLCLLKHLNLLFELIYCFDYTFLQFYCKSISPTSALRITFELDSCYHEGEKLLFDYNLHPLSAFRL